jgi:hypothetical protein
VFAERRLQAVMVGNTAAALHGAPVTILGIDFMFCQAPLNLKKLKAVAQSLRAVILKRYDPVSDLFRVVSDDQGMQLDFMTRLNGVRSFEGSDRALPPLSSREHQLKIASLADITKSECATGIAPNRQPQTTDWLLQRQLRRRPSILEQIPPGPKPPRPYENCVERAQKKPSKSVRYSTPGGAEYIVVCLPAFTPATVHRDDA